MSLFVDLHLHTNFSDGGFIFSDVLKKVKNQEIKLCSITDHDSVEYVGKIEKEAIREGIGFVRGVEISTFFEGGEVHILGYGYSLLNSEFEKFVYERFKNRQKRTVDMLELLKKSDIHISYNDVIAQSPGPYVGRPNVAKAMLSAGYVETFEEAFTEKYIGNNGKAYVPPTECRSELAIEQIKKAGGYAVLAHPGTFTPGFPYSERGLSERQIKKLSVAGLDGIEVFHPKHSKSELEFYLSIALRGEFKVTMGSDFHCGDYNPGYRSVPGEYQKEVILWLSEKASS